MDRVTCVSCGRPYDAATAAECSCLQRVRSFYCPHCSSCFCHKPERVASFWRSASPEMWSRRRSGAETPYETDEMALLRPLVMFADDDESARAIAARLIKALGYGIVLAANGAEALKLAAFHRPDLVITDALMPQLDGRELGRRIKQQRPGTRVVVITSVYTSARYKREALHEFAADEYLAKPITAAVLRDVVTRYLGDAGRGTGAV